MMVDSVEISKHQSLWSTVNHVPHRCSFIHCCNIANSHLLKLSSWTRNFLLISIYLYICIVQTISNVEKTLSFKMDEVILASFQDKQKFSEFMLLSTQNELGNSVKTV